MLEPAPGEAVAQDEAEGEELALAASEAVGVGERVRGVVEVTVGELVYAPPMPPLGDPERDIGAEGVGEAVLVPPPTPPLRPLAVCEAQGDTEGEPVEEAVEVARGLAVPPPPPPSGLPVLLPLPQTDGVNSEDSEAITAVGVDAAVTLDSAVVLAVALVVPPSFSEALAVMVLLAAPLKVGVADSENGAVRGGSTVAEALGDPVTPTDALPDRVTVAQGVPVNWPVTLAVAVAGRLVLAVGLGLGVPTPPVPVGTADPVTAPLELAAPVAVTVPDVEGRKVSAPGKVAVEVGVTEGLTRGVSVVLRAEEEEAEGHLDTVRVGSGEAEDEVLAVDEIVLGALCVGVETELAVWA